MKTPLKAWIQAHPIKACAFTAGLTYLSALSGFMLAEGCGMASLVLLAAIFLWFELVYHADCKKLMALIVVAGLLCAPLSLHAVEPAKAPIVGRAVAVAVIVGGTWAIAKMVSFCKRHFGKEKGTNAPPEEFFIAGQAPESGAVFSWTEEGYCTEQRLLPIAPIALTLQISVPSLTNATLSIAGDNDVQDLWSLQAELDAHGLPLFPTPGQAACYEMNRHPCEPEQVAISMDWLTKTISLGHGGIVVVLEGSDDLTSWQPLLRLNVVPGASVTVQDVTETGMGFYRLKLTEP